MWKLTEKATCYLEETFYERGTGWFKWLGYFMKKTYRRLQINFDKEVGREKGSYKGGTLGTSANIEYGWNWRFAFREFAMKNCFTNVQFLDY